MKNSLLARPMRALGTLALSGVIACGCFLPATPAYAVSAAEKAAEAESALNQLSAMQQTLDEASANYFQCLSDYQKALEEREATSARIDEISDEISDIQDRLGTRARDMYRNGSTSFLDMLLGAASFDELAKNWDLLNRVNESDADLSVKAKDLRSEQQEKETILKEQEAIAQEKSEAAGRAYEDAQIIVEQLQATYDSLSEEALQLLAMEQSAYITEGGVMNDDGTVTDIATGQVYSSAAEYSAVTGNAIVDRAYSILNSGKYGYAWGGTGGNGYFDCSGFVSYALTGQFDHRLGNTYTFLGWNQVSEPQPGDVCVNGGHTGIYIGNGQMIHAADEATGIVVGPVQDGMIYVRQ